jgi:hypothetical protein
MENFTKRSVGRRERLFDPSQYDVIEAGGEAPPIFARKYSYVGEIVVAFMVTVLIGMAVICGLLFFLLRPAAAATDVWLFYGWGPSGWSAGIDQIARRVRTLRGVNSVHVYPYYETQRAYNEAVATSHEHSLAFVGYSCGGNASLAVAGALAHNNRTAHVIALQPSVWCGRYPTTSNMRYVQDSWSYGTLGLGSYMPEGPPAGYTTFIQRPEAHGAADTDPWYQRDAVFAVGAVADPSRRWILEHHLQRTAPHVDRQDATVIWRRE